MLVLIPGMKPVKLAMFGTLLRIMLLQLLIKLLLELIMGIMLMIMIPGIMITPRMKLVRLLVLGILLPLLRLLVPGPLVTNCPFVHAVSFISEHSKVIKEKILKVSSCSRNIIFILSHNSLYYTNSNAVEDEDPKEQVQFTLLLNISISSICMAKRK